MTRSQATPAAGQLPQSIGALCAAQVRALGHRPLLTFYDDVTGERTELSWATFDNWASKTANLLVEELHARRGARLGLELTRHWIGAVVAVAAWKVGAAVVVGHAASDAEVLVVAEDDPRAGSGHPAMVVVGSGMGGRVTGSVAGIAFGDEVLAFADDYDDPAVTLDDAALVTPSGSLTQGELLAAAWGLLGPDDRLLSAAPLEGTDDVALGLVAPLAAGASVVWCPRAGGVDLAQRAAAERCTRIHPPPPNAERTPP